MGGQGSREVVDMTGIEGKYAVSLNIPLGDMLAAAKAMASAGGSGGGVASDPGGISSSMTDALQTLGLRLESSKAMRDQLIVDHAEKSPTEN